MKNEMLLQLLKRRKGRGLDVESLLKEEEPDGKQKEGEWSEDKDLEKEDGLAPKVAKQEGNEESEAGEGSFGTEAEEVLGRKPMSIAKSKSYERDEFNDMDDEDDIKGSSEIGKNKQVLESMKDDRIIEKLKSGRKPKGLWERVQANIAKSNK